MSNGLIVLEDAGGISMVPVELHYIWPSELDLMAEFAGHELREHWGDGSANPSIPPGWCISVFESAQA